MNNHHKVWPYWIIMLIGLVNISQAQDNIVYDDKSPESEIHAAINPKDNNNMIVAAINGFSNGETPSTVSIYYTKDFGNTWHKSAFKGTPTNQYLGGGDPVLKFDEKGTAYLAYLSIFAPTDFEGLYTILSYSSDQGVTWQSIVTNDQNTDKPWLAIDTFATSPFFGRKYIPTMEYIEEAIYISLTAVDQNNQVIFNERPTQPNPKGATHIPCIDVKRNGDIFISMLDLNYGKLLIERSTDGGKTFEERRDVVTLTTNIWGDGYSIPAIPDRLFTASTMAIDNSGGPFDGRIYVSYTDAETPTEPFNELLVDVKLTWSDDEGVSWSAPKVVHPTAPSATQQFYSALYVNEQGKLLIGWYDSRSDLTHILTDYYLAVSSDGGNTFEEVQVSSSPSKSSEMGKRNENFGIGEYTQVIATKDYAIPFWADGRSNDGDLNIYFAKVSINNLSEEWEEISKLTDRISVVSTYPNPTNDSATLKILAKDPSVVRWVVHDALGKKLSESTLPVTGQGIYLRNISLENQASGTYFIRVFSDGQFIKAIRLVKL